MALYECGGIGGAKTKTGTFTRNTSATTVDLGFKPKYLLLFKSAASSSSMAAGDVIMIYDESWSTARIVYYYRPTSNANNLNKPNVGDHLTFSSTGFTVAATSSTYTGTYYYFAVG